MGVLEQILTLSNLILCLGIVALVWIQRRGAEVMAHKLGKDLKNSEIWTKFLVPIGPLGTGALLTLIPQLPIPEMFAEGMLNRMVFGVALGLISTLVYRLVKKNILDKLGKKDEKTPYVEE